MWDIAKHCPDCCLFPLRGIYFTMAKALQAASRRRTDFLLDHGCAPLINVCVCAVQIQPGREGGHLFKLSVAFVVDKVSNTTKINDVLGHTNTKSLIDVERNARRPTQKFTKAQNLAHIAALTANVNRDG